MGADRRRRKPAAAGGPDAPTRGRLAVRTRPSARMLPARTMTRSRTTSALRIDHVTIMVGSLAASIPYYDALLSLLGYEKLRDHVYTDGDGFHFQFMQAAEGTRPYERHGAGVNHIGFSAPDERAVLAVRDGMRARGFPAPEVQHLGGAVALFMKDPDGQRFEVTAYPPGASVVD